MDIVITWVDGSDEAWLAERKKYETKGLSIDAVGDRRFRDWGFLKYLMILRNMQTHVRIFILSPMDISRIGSIRIILRFA